MRITHHPEAQAEMIDAANFYESKLAGLGGDFLDAVDAAVAAIVADPGRYPVVEDDIRRCRVKRFPYCVYYRHGADWVRILVVMHHSRHPDYWKGRK
jgi:plasmid stabilization system protein ParE